MELWNCLGAIAKRRIGRMLRRQGTDENRHCRNAPLWRTADYLKREDKSFNSAATNKKAQYIETQNNLSVFNINSYRDSLNQCSVYGMNE